MSLRNRPSGRTAWSRKLRYRVAKEVTSSYPHRASRATTAKARALSSTVYPSRGLGTAPRLCSNSPVSSVKRFRWSSLTGGQAMRSSCTPAMDLPLLCHGHLGRLGSPRRDDFGPVAQPPAGPSPGRFGHLTEELHALASHRGPGELPGKGLGPPLQGGEQPRLFQEPPDAGRHGVGVREGDQQPAAAPQNILRVEVGRGDDGPPCGQRKGQSPAGDL